MTIWNHRPNCLCTGCLPPVGGHKHPPGCRCRSCGNVTLEERYWRFVDRRGPDECWLWTGSTDGNNKYGRIKPTRARRDISATWVAWFLAYGEWPEHGKDVCHHCDVTLCQNPRHLFVGTRQENIQDCIRKGRFYGRPDILAARTHCAHGHEFTVTNTRYVKAGGRKCRTCDRQAHRTGQRPIRVYP